MKNILVTGGAGFIGSHTCVELLDAGYSLVILDNFSNSGPQSLDAIKAISGKDFKFYPTDILNYDELCTIFEENDIDAVIHFAGLKAVGESVTIPLSYYHNNVTGTIELIRVMERYNCKNMVFSSSATVYGMNNPIPYIEHYPTSATSPYGSTKVMIEQILTDLCASDPEWSVTLLRYFNPIGAHKSGLIGENPNGVPNNLMPYISKVATGDLHCLNIYGNDYETADGTGVRDYIHVVDLSNGHLSALDYTLKNKGVEAFNLGTGKGSSVLEVVAAFERVSGVRIPQRFAPRRAGDIGEFYADTQKAEKMLNWVACSTLDDMCADAWKFVQKTLDNQVK